MSSHLFSLLLMPFHAMSNLRYVLVAVAICWAAADRLPAAERLQVAGQTMGTRYAVTIDSPRETDTEASVIAEIEKRLAEINAQMSTWEETSEISRFNRSDSGNWFPVSAEFAVVVEEAVKIHEISQGAFDPTVSPLIELWGFGKGRPDTVPDQEAIDAALQSVGMENIEVRPAPPALRKAHPDVQLNLSAIAKGYAVDAIAELLLESGRRSFVVDIGGETRAGIAKASGDPWRIGVESPEADLRRGQPPERILSITEAAVATSGDYRNRYEVDGVTYSHTIDPATGHPVRNSPASVSVIHESCMTADALATALMVLGPDRGIELATAHGYSVLFQMVGEDGKLTARGTGQFETSNGKRSEQKSSDSWVLFVAAGILFLVAVGGMAIGVLVSNREIKGSCGGLASMPGSDGKSICELCSIPREECVNEELRQQMREASSHCETAEDCSDTAVASGQASPD